MFRHQYAQAVIPIVIGTILMFGLRFSTKLTFKRESALQIEMSVIASEAGIEFLNSRGNSSLNWSAFVRYFETKRLFMLYVQSKMFHLIPKRALSPAALIDLREVLQQQIGTKTTRRAGNFNISAFRFFLILATAVVLVYLAMHGIRR